MQAIKLKSSWKAVWQIKQCCYLSAKVEAAILTEALVPLDYFSNLRHLAYAETAVGRLVNSYMGTEQRQLLGFHI
jgi:hypothetical protein